MVTNMIMMYDKTLGSYMKLIVGHEIMLIILNARMTTMTIHLELGVCNFQISSCI